MTKQAQGQVVLFITEPKNQHVLDSIGLPIIHIPNAERLDAELLNHPSAIVVLDYFYCNKKFANQEQQLPDNHCELLCRKMKHQFSKTSRIIFYTIPMETPQATQITRTFLLPREGLAHDAVSTYRNWLDLINSVLDESRRISSVTKKLFWDDSAKAIKFGDDIIKLDRTQKVILRYLLAKEGSICTYIELYENCWNQKGINLITAKEALYSQISRINKRLKNALIPYHISNETDDGYRLDRLINVDDSLQKS
ncbi:MAG TPA: helix-turn-helix domain-containing protein [Anaerolineales bacterium]|nr:helix-turn-helix domain-containing protein [Anaerolineales bacterium]